MNVFIKFFKIIQRIRMNKSVKDSGMRTDIKGNIYIDKEVFFNRPEVKKNIDDIIINSSSITKR